MQFRYKIKIIWNLAFILFRKIFDKIDTEHISRTVHLHVRIIYYFTCFILNVFCYWNGSLCKGVLERKIPVVEEKLLFLFGNVCLISIPDSDFFPAGRSLLEMCVNISLRLKYFFNHINKTFLYGLVSL